ncbi:TraB/GumN family protein [Paenibacillus bovis]|uniref:Polysaccharide biosynthesis protein GumN n=1 Tax=Paenibacillus bovis TaxID=1616788 RepID=A0A172ZLX1_9BACL|nr:TraB/GumN family protein [Paenibacillus bovis]ANF98641.1 polysaccharide biosynthesis protein GumN [Paenibacillus bovis]
MKLWRKMLLSLTVSASLLTAASVPAAMAAPQPATVKVNMQKVNYGTDAPVISEKTTLVPLRSTLKALDAELTGTTPDSITVVVNGKSITLQSKLTEINGVAYVPVRIIGDAAGYSVRWDAQTRTVQLVSTSPGLGGTEAPVAEASQTGRGFMWEVQSNGNTVYLVGSMHLADKSFYPLRKEYEEAFAKADHLGVEVDISKAAGEEQQKLIMQLGMYQDGSTLKDHISSETYTKLGDILEKNKMKRDALDPFKPWVAEVMISTLKPMEAGYEASAGIDLHFIQKAMERKIPVIELESYESQLNMFNNFSKQLQEKNLNTALDNYDEMGTAMDQMAEMWKTGNDQALLEFTNTMSDDAEYNQAMLTDRNIDMANKIDGYLKNGNKEEYFIVVGAGHYLGDQGIVQLLKNKGYDVVRK